MSRRPTACHVAGPGPPAHVRRCGRGRGGATRSGAAKYRKINIGSRPGDADTGSVRRSKEMSAWPPRPSASSHCIWSVGWRHDHGRWRTHHPNPPCVVQNVVSVGGEGRPAINGRRKVACAWSNGQVDLPRAMHWFLVCPQGREGAQRDTPHPRFLLCSSSQYRPIRGAATGTLCGPESQHAASGIAWVLAAAGHRGLVSPIWTSCWWAALAHRSAVDPARSWESWGTSLRKDAAEGGVAHIGLAT